MRPGQRAKARGYSQETALLKRKLQALYKKRANHEITNVKIPYGKQPEIDLLEKSLAARGISRNNDSDLYSEELARTKFMEFKSYSPQKFEEAIKSQFAIITKIKMERLQHYMSVPPPVELFPPAREEEATVADKELQRLLTAYKNKFPEPKKAFDKVLKRERDRDTGPYFLENFHHPKIEAAITQIEAQTARIKNRIDELKKQKKDELNYARDNSGTGNKRLLGWRNEGDMDIDPDFTPSQARKKRRSNIAAADAIVTVRSVEDQSNMIIAGNEFENVNNPERISPRFSSSEEFPNCDRNSYPGRADEKKTNRRQYDEDKYQDKYDEAKYDELYRKFQEENNNPLIRYFNLMEKQQQQSKKFSPLLGKISIQDLPKPNSLSIVPTSGYVPPYETPTAFKESYPQKKPINSVSVLPTSGYIPPYENPTALKKTIGTPDIQSTYRNRNQANTPELVHSLKSIITEIDMALQSTIATPAEQIKRVEGFIERLKGL